MELKPEFPLNPSHESHIGRVAVSFVLSSEYLKPNWVTEELGVEPDSSAQKGDIKNNFLGQKVGFHNEGYWRSTTKGKLESKDINVHFAFLLDILLPKTDVIIKFSFGGETFFDVLWESSYLYAGTGPVLSAKNILGISFLKAGLGFDIYQIN